MESKYYTPSIEEFYVGFEYEVNYGENDWQKECLWAKPEVVTLPYMNLENIRVKYLDKEDIESLGFEQESIYSFKHKDWYIEVSCNELHNQKDTLDEMWST